MGRPTLASALTADHLRRRYGIDRSRVRAAIAALTNRSVAVRMVDEPSALRAADLRAENHHRIRCPISLADCMRLAAAGPEDRVATTDSHVLDLAGREGIAVTPLSAPA